MRKAIINDSADINSDALAECLFDNGCFTWSEHGDKAVGFIEDVPAVAKFLFRTNIMQIDMCGDWSSQDDLLKIIKSRLDSDETRVSCSYFRSYYQIGVYIFYRDE